MTGKCYIKGNIFKYKCDSNLKIPTKMVFGIKVKKHRNRFNEFLKETSIHGLRLLLFYTPFKYARVLWKFLMVAVIIWTHFIIINLIIEYIDQPTELHMSTNRVHIANSPFPAFGVCNGNKFSRKKLQAYAEEFKLQTQLVFEITQLLNFFHHSGKGVQSFFTSGNNLRGRQFETNQNTIARWTQFIAESHFSTNGVIGPINTGTSGWIDGIIDITSSVFGTITFFNSSNTNIQLMDDIGGGGRSNPFAGMNTSFKEDTGLFRFALCNFNTQNGTSLIGFASFNQCNNPGVFISQLLHPSVASLTMAIKESKLSSAVGIIWAAGNLNPVKIFKLDGHPVHTSTSSRIDGIIDIPTGIFGSITLLNSSYGHIKYPLQVIIIWWQFICVTIGEQEQLRIGMVVPALKTDTISGYFSAKLCNQLFEKQQSYKPFYLAKTPNEMFQYLLTLNDFYIFPYGDTNVNETIVKKLDNILKYVYNTEQYPIRDILKDLGPDCDGLIIKGIVYGIPVNISDYFRKRLTSSGACCIFNYKRESYSTDEAIRESDNEFVRNHAPVPFEANSILNSIQFVLQADPDDATIRDFDIDAFMITVFPQEDYSNIQSSHIGEILVNYYSIVEIPIQPEFYDSSESVRQFSPDVRKCYFPEEGQMLLNRSYYSIDECLLKCRSTSMMKHCGCVTPPMVSTPNLTVCNLVDLTCLRQWNAIWYGWSYFDYVKSASEDDSTNGGYACAHCLPLCDGVQFRIFLNEMTMRRTNGEAYSSGLLKGIDDKKPLAIIKLFFKQRFAQATEMDIVGDWIVQLNRLGGIMGLMYGFSLISYIEIFYFASGKYFTFYWKQWKSNAQRKLSGLSTKARSATNREEVQPVYGLYWNELKPKSRSYIRRTYEKNY
ncbi:pickpocket 18 [Haematobia irritans]|uniref:pickpocket 18 n=1 Tax=Haematobia irritans TaxID=7368 RepID=UPI003F50BF96